MSIPELVGNQRIIVVSDQAGRSNIMARFRQIGLEVDPKDPGVARLLEIVKEREAEGYAYDGADASSSCWRGTSCTPCPTTSPCRASACWPSGGSMRAAS